MSYGSNGSLALILSIVIMIATILITIAPYWKINNAAASDNANSGIVKFMGLWYRCNSVAPGTFYCDTYDTTFLKLSASLQAQRAMMIVASIAAVAGVLCATLGMDCITVMGDHSSKAKKYTGRTGGACVILTGCLTLAAVSWYAVDVVQQFRRSQLNKETAFIYEFGSALYVGWVSSILSLISGAILLCCSYGSSEDSFDDHPYNPAKPTRRSNTEYV